MQQDGCRRNRYFEKSLDSFKTRRPGRRGDDLRSCGDHRKIRIVSASVRGTYGGNHPGFLDRHENGCKERGDENDRRDT
jgi:hypothetical protein